MVENEDIRAGDGGVTPGGQDGQEGDTGAAVVVMGLPTTPSARRSGPALRTPTSCG